MSAFPIEIEKVTWPRRLIAVVLIFVLAPIMVGAWGLDLILKAVGFYDGKKTESVILLGILGLLILAAVASLFLLSGCGTNCREYNIKKDRTELEGTLMISQR